MAVEINAVYEGQLHCRAKHGPSGIELTTDAPVDNGGKGASFSPTDLVATALGVCMLTIMGLVSERNKLNLEGTTVKVLKEMSASPPRRISKLTAVFTLPAGRNFSDADKTKLENAAKTCPVHQSLHPAIEMDIRFVYP